MEENENLLLSKSHFLSQSYFFFIHKIFTFFHRFEEALIAKIAKYRFLALFEKSRNQYRQPEPDQDIAQFKENMVNQVLDIFEFAFEKNMNMQNNLEEKVKKEIQIVENAAKFYLLGVGLEKNVLGEIIEPGKKNKKTEHEMGEEILNSFIRLFTNDQEVAKLFKSANVEQPRMGIAEEGHHNKELTKSGLSLYHPKPLNKCF